jgi:hypothetical protein
MLRSLPPTRVRRLTCERSDAGAGTARGAARLGTEQLMAIRSGENALARSGCGGPGANEVPLAPLKAFRAERWPVN